MLSLQESPRNGLWNESTSTESETLLASSHLTRKRANNVLAEMRGCSLLDVCHLQEGG